MKTTVMISSGTAIRAKERTDSQFGTIVIYGLGVAACITGFLAAASLLAGMLASGGPVGLASSWITAVFGM